MSGPLSVLFGFLSTPSQKWQTECSQCLNGRSSALKTGHNIFVSFLPDALKSTIARVVKINEGKYGDRGGKRGMDICNAWSLPQQVKNNRQLYHSH